jgi:hypothetical protein
MDWRTIETVMDTLERPSGGFTLAHRGIVTMPDRTKVFVKIGVDEETKRWAQKEIAIYMFLQKHDYPFIPKFLAHNYDRTGFALEALTASNGWDWTETWDEQRLDTTLKAMEQLAAIIPTEEEKLLFGKKGITSDTDGWQILLRSPDKQLALRRKLSEKGHTGLASNLDIPALAKKSAQYVFEDHIVVHQDVRADNCAWCPTQQTVRLIDWNWTQLGDRAIDRNAMLVHVYRSGLNILQEHRSYLDASALEWLAGFWLDASTNPVRGNSPSLRDYQLASGVAALELAAKA